MLTLPSVAEARPPRYSSTNPGVHRSFPRRIDPYDDRGDRSFYQGNYNSCYNCAVPIPDRRRGYDRGYHRGYRDGLREGYYQGDNYRGNYQRDQGRSGFSIYYETYR